MNKLVTVLGSTGSIGVNGLKVIGKLKDYNLFGIACNKNARRLIAQMHKYRPEKAVIADDSKYLMVRRSAPSGCKVMAGTSAVEELAADKADIVLNAVVGFAGLRPSISAIKSGKRICLANKESLVAGGHLIMRELKKNKKAELIPVDSEHSAIFQALMAGRKKEIKKIIITASGGPFRELDKDKLSRVTVKEALNHPNWKMGNKVTIDSATLANKALEVIEAKWIFNLSMKDIEVVVHPESIVHSLVEFRDNSVLAQLSFPDMKVPIQFALTYPDRLKMGGKSLNLAKIGTLTFEKPDYERFPALKMGFRVAKEGGSTGTVFNGANEVAVEKFLEGKISFTKIPEICERALNAHKKIINPDLDKLLEIDNWVRNEVESFIK